MTSIRRVQPTVLVNRQTTQSLHATAVAQWGSSRAATLGLLGLLGFWGCQGSWGFGAARGVGVLQLLGVLEVWGC